MTTDPDRQPKAYLTPAEFVEARWVVARVPPSLRDELRARQRRVGAFIESHTLLGHAKTFFSLMHVPLLPSIAENEKSDGVGRNGNLNTHWADFRDGLFAEIADRVDATERLWKQTFDISPLAETPTGRALLAKKSFARFKKLTNAAVLSARAAKTSADAADRSAKMAEAADKRATDSKDAEDRAEKRSRWAVGWAAVAGIAAVAAVVVPLLLPSPAPVVDLRQIGPELTRLSRALERSQLSHATAAGAASTVLSVSDAGADGPQTPAALTPAGNPPQ